MEPAVIVQFQDFIEEFLRLKKRGIVIVMLRSRKLRSNQMKY
jgi:hypothetical protein